jgi:hypothetical protein
MKYIKLEDLEDWLGIVEKIEPRCMDGFIKSNLAVLKKDFKSKINLEKKHNTVKDKLIFLRGHQIANNFEEYAEVFMFIVKHFYQKEYPKSVVKEYYQTYKDDAPHTVSKNIQYNFGNAHMDGTEWMLLDQEIYNEIWEQIKEEEK